MSTSPERGRPDVPSPGAGTANGDGPTRPLRGTDPRHDTGPIHGADPRYNAGPGYDADPRHDTDPHLDTTSRRSTDPFHGTDPGGRTDQIRDPDLVAGPRPDRKAVIAEQKQRYGGIKWGAAFFGWLTAAGTGLILTALAAALGAGFGLAQASGNAGQAVEELGQAAQNPGAAGAAGVVSAIVVLVILLVAYYCGGYVAGRMARFNGAKQGIAVWVWAIVAAVVVAILAAVAGDQFNILANLNALPRIPVNEGVLTVAGIITALIALIASLVGAVLGGLAGMRFHRKVDHVGFDH